MQKSTINEAHKILIELGLIESIESDEKIVSFQKARYKICDLKPLSNEEQQKLYEKYGLQSETDIRIRYTRLNYIQHDFLKLFDIKLMKKAYKDLGPIKFHIAKSIAKYFNLDYNMFKRYLDNEAFSKKLAEVRQIVLKKNKDIEDIPKLRKGRRKKLSIQEGYNILLNCHIKNGQLLDRSEWGTHQLLRYFCIKYKEVTGVDYVFNNIPFCSKEAKDIAQLYKAFNNNSNLVINYIDYFFDELVDRFESIGTGLLKHSNTINTYMQKYSKTGYKRKIRKNDKVSEELIQWIKQNVSSFFEKYKLVTMRDLFWLKQSVIDGNAYDSIKKVVEYAEFLNLVPKGNENIKFSKDDK